VGWADPGGRVRRERRCLTSIGPSSSAVDDHEAPHIPALPKAFEHYRYELGAAVYGTARHAAAVMRNFDFFGAPLAGIVCMHRDLGPADALSVGMWNVVFLHD
jgi:hypothetical protein